MKKFLLSTLFCLLAITGIQAEEVTFVAEGASYSDSNGVTMATGNIPGNTYASENIELSLTQKSSSVSNVNSNGHVRWYKYDILNVTPKNGVTITKIVFNTTGGEKYCVAPIANTGTATASTADNTITWEGATTSTLELAADNGQIRFTTMTVTYTTEGGSVTPDQGGEGEGGEGEEGEGEGEGEGGSTPDTTGNLVSNPGFEEWTDGKPNDWATLATSNATIEQSNDAHSGNYAVVVKGAASNKRLASKAYTLAAGNYTMTAYVKANGEDAGYYRLGYATIVDGAAKEYVYSEAAAAAAPAEWTKATFDFTLAAETELVLVVMNNKSGNGASFLVDDISLTAASTEGGEGEGEGEGEDEGETEVTFTTIAEVLAAGAGNAATKGTVVATYARGFLMNDGTGSILVYLNSAPSVTAGDAVNVSGTTSVYGGLLQFAAGSTVEKTGTATVNHPTATVMDGAAMEAYLAAPEIKYVEYTGTLTVNGSYYNVAVEGAATAIGSIQYPQDSIKANLTNGAVVKVTGYTIGVSSSKYVNTMAVKVEVIEGGEEPEAPTVVKEYTVAEAIAAYVDGKQIPAIVTGYIVGAMNSTGYVPEFGATTVITNLLLSDDPEEDAIENCIIVQLPTGDIRTALNLVDHPDYFQKKIKITGSIEKYFQQAGLKNPTAYEFTDGTGIEDVILGETAAKVIFDITGRRIDQITNPGIYIVNGKKVLVK